MPKDTFYNLDKEKKKKITDELIYEFSDKPFSQVNIKTIVENLGIARGSFYQYFNDLEDSYFYILDKKTYDIHILFMDTLKNNNGNIYDSLQEFGEDIAEIIFREDVYKLYKNRYLYWDEGLNKSWENSHENFRLVFNIEQSIGIDQEKIYFFRAVVHSLIERNFREDWDKDTFVEKYKLHIRWIMQGVINGNR
ncbi:TetR/AcrR family transcriptional regulator [Anaerococcus nagyae]|uniref:TetR/AcrR family transcriptional regulator n=1 Tax=Anaerococcus nagyae TaxID=1755241 RepID=UPI001AE93DE9|nr:TetR/AcrR family transcriptional regulator [Anaerococcus nagyae]MBP2069370.1 AcrR family transcriptional regulator [Anaerococcus nagyae]